MTRSPGPPFGCPPRLTRRSALLFAALLALAGPPMAAAQGAQEAARPFTLTEALGLAERNSPAYERARLDGDAAAADRRLARGALLPTLAASISTGGFNQRVLTGEDAFGRVVRLEDPADFTRSSSSQSLTLQNVPLFDGGRRLHTLRAAERAADAAGHAAEGERRRLVAEVTRRYHAVGRAERGAVLEAGLLEAARERLEAARGQLRIAAASPVDVLGAEVDVARQEAELERARGDVELGWLALFEEIGARPAGALRIADAPPEPFDPNTLDADSLVAAALANAPRLARLEADTRAADRRMRAERALRWPQLTGFASLNRSVGAEGSQALFELNPLNRTLNFGVSATLPLFDGGQRSVAAARAGVHSAALAAELRAATLATEREVRAALLELGRAYRASRLAERAAALATERLALAREQYRLGMVTFVELQAVVAQAAQAERDALDARYAFAAALATLEQHAAHPIPTEADASVSVPSGSTPGDPMHPAPVNADAIR